MSNESQDVTRARNRRNRSLSKGVYESIKESILTCKFKPGEIIFERELVDEYGVSKTPIREALMLLAKDGLIRSISGIGHMITPVTFKDVREVFDLRQILEIAVLERAVNSIEDEKLEQISPLVGETFDLCNESDRLQWASTNLQFHIAIAEAAGNQKLTQIYRNILEEMSRILIMDLGWRSDTEAMVEGHTQIIHALRSRNTSLAIDIARKEIENSLKHVQKFLSVNSSP